MWFEQYVHHSCRHQTLAPRLLTLLEGGVGGVALPEECHWDWALRFKGLHHCLYFMLMVEDRSSELPAVLPYHVLWKHRIDLWTNHRTSGINLLL